jgi:hypothetical protein
VRIQAPARVFVLAIAAGLCAAVAGCGDGASIGTTVHRPATASSAGTGSHFRFFSPTSPWNSEPGPDAPIDPASTAIVGALSAEVGAEQSQGDGPWISTSRYGVPVYRVPADQPTVRVTLDRSPGEPAMQAAFDAVPLPSGARAASGTDGHLVLWQPSSDRLWEFWRLIRTPSGPAASWGGAIQDVSEDPGVYGPEAWPGAEPWWGASGSSLSIAGGLITLEDLRSGEINHALALAVPDVKAGVYASPARRTDGRSQSPLALPEGARLRLDPDLDVGSLHLPRLTRMIAEAAQRYGIVVRDGSSVVQFYGQEALPGRPDPYGGRDGYFEGEYPSQLLAAFPWKRLQLMRMELHPDAG